MIGTDTERELILSHIESPPRRRRRRWFWHIRQWIRWQATMMRTWNQ